MIKNEIVRCKISSLSNDGNAVAKHDGETVFVPFGVPGDTADIRIVKVMKNYCFGIISEITEPSEYRIPSDCPHFTKCGGCSFRTVSYSQELIQKKQFVENAIKRIGKIDAVVDDVFPCNFDGYRNKAQFPVMTCEDGSISFGFFYQRSHRITELKSCRIIPPEFSDIAKTICEFYSDKKATVYSEKTGHGLLRHLFFRKASYDGGIQVCIVINGNTLPLSDEIVTLLTEKYSDIKSISYNINRENTNVILGKKTVAVYGEERLKDYICGVPVYLSPASFFQVNHYTAEAIYRKVAELLPENCENLLDLYCGAGTIGLSVSDRTKHLTGIEIIEPSVKSAVNAAKEMGLDTCEFICDDAGKAVDRLIEKGKSFDAVILDPPRKGCSAETIENVLKLNPGYIIMVSCNPATLARDIAVFKENGYSIGTLYPYDMFPRTSHVETVVLMSRVEK